MPPTLAGPVGKWIKLRLESAAVRCAPTCWEDLSLYLDQGDKWEWDKQIILQWRQEITAHFLECCRDCEIEEETIQKYALALADGLQEIDGGEAADEVGTTEAGKGEDCTIVGPKSLPPTRHPQHDNQPRRIIFLGLCGSTDSDGLTVRYTDATRSRINREIVVERWGLEDKMYKIAVEEDDTGVSTKSIEAINLTWELAQGSAKKSYSTTFEVVPDDQIDSDAEFGQNRFDSLSKRSRMGHSVSKSLPGPSESHRSSKHTKPRSHTEPSSSIAPTRDEFVLESVAVGLSILAGREWEKKHGSRPSLSTSPEDDDESSVLSRRTSGRTSNTSLSKDSSYKAQSKRGRHK